MSVELAVTPMMQKLNARGHYPQLCQPQLLAEQIKRELVYGAV